MISVVEGAVGAGKTYWTVREIAKHLASGGIVASNLELRLPALRRLTGRRLSPWQLLPLSAESCPFDIPRGDLRGHGSRRVMVVLDEALNWFPSSRESSERGSDWQRWLRQSDKLGQDVFFVAQRFDRAAKWLRELAQVCVSVKNFGQVRFLGLPVGRLVGMRRLSSWCRWDLALRSRLGWGLYIINRDVWSCYETSTLYGFPASANAYDSVGTAWPRVRTPRVSLVLGFLFCVSGAVRLTLNFLF